MPTVHVSESTFKHIKATASRAGVDMSSVVDEAVQHTIRAKQAKQQQGSTDWMAKSQPEEK